MRPKDIRRLLLCALEKGSGHGELCSLYIEGGPGVGKSTLVRDVAQQAGVGWVDFRLILRDPVDLRGLPYVDREAGVARWVPPSELPRDGRGILMFDDLPTAAQAVQAAAYQITIWPHRLGEYQLPEGWIVVAAGNRRGEGVYHPVPAALRNRFTYVTMDVHLDDWLEWAVAARLDPIVIAFVRWAYGRERKEELRHWPLYHFEADRDWAFPTPRGWERVSRKVQARLEDDVLAEAIVGDVGPAAGQEFMAYRRVAAQIPDPRDILAGRFQVPRQVDVLYATVTSVVYHAEPHQFDTALEYAERLPKEFAVLLAKLLASKDPVALARAQAFDRWTEYLGDLVA